MLNPVVFVFCLEKSTFVPHKCGFDGSIPCFLFKSCFDLVTFGGTIKTCQPLPLVRRLDYIRLLFAFSEVWKEGLRTSPQEEGNMASPDPNIPGAASVVEQRPKLAR